MKTLISILLYVLTINIVNAQSNEQLLKLCLLNELNFVRKYPTLYSQMKHLEAERLDTLTSKYSLDIDVNLTGKAQYYSNQLGTTINNSKSKTYSLYHSNMKYNESICITDSISNGISQFIKDLNVANKGHRKHLLGINNSDTKIGIGIYQFTNPNMQNYWLIVIITE